MSPSDPSCRILVISSSLDGSLAFIKRIMTDGEQVYEIAKGDVKIPWTITNKYYTADVHFAAYTVQEFNADLLEGVPAVVFVWTKGEPYRDDVDRLSGDIQEYEPEVSLAVRMDAITDDDEDNGEIDQFLSSLGFEYVCVRDDHGDDDANDDGVPNFPRVIDALSTVMWPSMLGDDEVEGDESCPELGFEELAEVAETHARIFGGDDVLGRLEEMRAEISAVENLEERRRAAAMVALGVVYGL